MAQVTTSKSAVAGAPARPRRARGLWASIDKGGREELIQSISPFSPHLEQPLPVVLDEAWGQLVPEHVKS